jgi:hypothetical protein
MRSMRAKRLWAALGLCLGLAASPLAGAATLELRPSTLDVTPGQTFAVDIATRNDVSDLSGFQLNLGFPSTLLAATAVAEGPFLPTGGATYFLPGDIDNTGGTVSFMADSLLGDVPGVTGSGVLASITFQGMRAGTANLSLSNALLLHSNLTPVVPVPPAWLLFLSGWAWVGVWRIMRAPVDQVDRLGHRRVSILRDAED